MKSSRKIDISKSSLVSLKAELSRKQEEVNKAKAQAQAHYIRPLPQPKKQTVWTKQNAGVSERGEKDIEEQVEEDDVLKKSRMALEAKSKLYDKLSQSSAADDEGRFLVDFQQKSLTGETSSAALPPEENEEHHSSDEYDKTSDPEEDWVDYVDCLGRTRRCLRKDLPYIKENDLRLFESLGGFDDKNKPTTTATSSTITTAEGEPQLLSSDMRRELLRQKWEEQEEQLRNKSDIHYQDVLFDEARSHGVGYYGFSQDEAERRAQQEALTKLRQETHREQEASKGLRERRQQQLQARIKAARQRKRARMGLPPEEDEPEAPASAEVEPETTESQKQEESEPKPNPEPPKKTQIRPWDIGKEGVKDVMSQEEWVKKKRTERPQEFAPPSSYQPDFVPNPSELQPERPKVTLFFSSKKPTQEEGSASVTPDKKLWSDSDAATRTSVNRPGFKRKYPKIEDLQEEEKEEERGRGTEIPPPPTFDYYGPSSSTQGASRNVSAGNKDLESSITAGLKYLRQQAEERESQKEKGLLDII